MAISNSPARYMFEQLLYERFPSMLQESRAGAISPGRAEPINIATT
jgi:hypothetical protein